MAVESPRPVRNAEYYLREQPLNTPSFEGRGAKLLGIEGRPVDGETFLNLHDGYTTKDGQRDRKLPRYMHKERRGSFEMTFNLPKCGSILKEVGGDTRIGDIMTQARRAAQEEIEGQAYARCPWERPNNLIMAAFRHPGSRLDDPHAHDHLWIANLTHTKKGWKAVELGYLDTEKVASVYRDAMMRGFRQLGYKVRQVGKEYEIVGVPAEVKAKFSRRHADIAERENVYERKKGAPLTSKAKSKLSVHGRPEKPTDRPLEERRAGWLSRISHEQYDGLRGLVDAAMTSAAMQRFQSRLKSYASKLRQTVVRQHDAPEREQNRGYGR